MSDGPHRSLPLRPKYRRMAERAYKPAFSLQEVCEAAEAALVQDASIEVRNVIRELIDIVDGADLFSRQLDEVQRRLQELRDDPAVHPLAANAIDCTEMAVRQGLEGRAAIEDGIATALCERLDANGRTTEEHYLSERGNRASRTIRDRMTDVSASMSAGGSFTRIARSLMGDRSVPVLRAPASRSGLDDGVAL
ncbi:hypothetical protein JQ506_01805 [Shinella sp. PSBB067]|uniref:hypothetical protein n=1 Tax=Shinella sp. PSBB067 TaxID=2715959 RepID=UPI00193C184E|nr:hypothetical protein [Shinella sp. PSBB067]QRI63773.1 hypothetical protein JQ506_01805 [Shinella sp. PSBB067]